MDPQEWSGNDPDDRPSRSFTPPAAPYAPADAPAPYAPAPHTAAVQPSGPRDPYAYDPTPAAAGRNGYPQPGLTSAQPAYQAPQPGPTFQPGSAAQQTTYPQGPYPQPYAAGAYGQRSQYGQYAPTSYGQGGYQPLPFGGLPPLAAWGSRVGALLIDSIVPTVLIVVGVGVMLLGGTPGIDEYGEPTTVPTLAGAAIAGVTQLAAVVFSLWNRIFRMGRTGQSIGKRALGIRLLSERTMSPPGAGLTFGRELAHYVDGAFYVGYLWPLWDAKSQTLADKICSTVVVADG